MKAILKFTPGYSLMQGCRDCKSDYKQTLVKRNRSMLHRKYILIFFAMISMCMMALSVNAQDIIGNWKVISLEGSIKMKTLPLDVMKKVRKKLVGQTFVYQADGSYTGPAAGKNVGSFKIQNGEILHYDFLDHLSLKGNLRIAGDEMQIAVKRADFLSTLSSTLQGAMTSEQVSELYTISDEIIYHLKKE